MARTISQHRLSADEANCDLDDSASVDSLLLLDKRDTALDRFRAQV